MSPLAVGRGRSPQRAASRTIAATSAVEAFRAVSGHSLAISGEEGNDLPANRLRWYHIDPMTKWVYVWDGIGVIAHVYTVTVTPFEVAFLPAPQNALEPLFVINRLMDLVFLLDMLSNFFRVSGPPGEQETRLAVIARRYVLSWFCIDLLSTLTSLFDIVPLITTSQSEGKVSKSPYTSFRVMRALRLFKLVRLVGASRQLKAWQVRMGTPRATVTIASTIGQIFVFAHVCACILGLMTVLASTPLDTWLATHGYCTPAAIDVSEVDGIECADPSMIYLQCLWWGGGMLLGAPLVISPPQGPYERHFSESGHGAYLTAAEQIVVLLMKTCVALLWTTVIAKFVGVYNTLDPDASDFRNGWDALNRYISFFRIDTSSAVALRTYYLERSDLVKQKSRARVVADFSPLLVEDFMWRYNQRWISRAPCFALVLEQMGSAKHGAHSTTIAKSFLLKISLAMTPRIFVPKERPPARALYIITKGTAIFDGRALRNGDAWGSEDVFLDSMPNARRKRAQATSHLHALVITAADLEALKHEFRAPYLLTRLWACIRAAGAYIMEIYRQDRKMLRMRVGNEEGDLRPTDLERRLNLEDEDPRKLTTVRATSAEGRKLLNSNGLPLYRLYFNIIDVGAFEIVRETGMFGEKRVLPMRNTEGKSTTNGPNSLNTSLPDGDSDYVSSTSLAIDGKDGSNNGVSRAGDGAKLAAQVGALSAQVAHLTMLVETMAQTQPARLAPPAPLAPPARSVPLTVACGAIGIADTRRCSPGSGRAAKRAAVLRQGAATTAVVTQV